MALLEIISQMSKGQWKELGGQLASELLDVAGKKAQEFIGEQKKKLKEVMKAQNNKVSKIPPKQADTSSLERLRRVKVN